MTGWRTAQQKIIDDAADARARKIAREEIVRAAQIIRKKLKLTADQHTEMIDFLLDQAIEEIKEGDPE